MDELWNEYNSEYSSDHNVILSEFLNSLILESTLASLNVPDVFVPYYFVKNYNVLEIISKEFDITLPIIPAKKDYKARFYYYAEVCQVLYRFRIDNDMSPFELYAFLYDFAPKYIGGVSSYIIENLPAPKSAFFIGGGGRNGDRLAEEDDDGIFCWQCNPDTRAGDMIVMYLTSPISAISSVWRSCSVGFNDPFFYYYRCTYIGKPIKVKRIGLDKIKSDKILGMMPIVSKNMQGINGVELKPSEYNHIVEISKANAVKLEYTADISDHEYATEKEVEDSIIKPLLKKLCYNNDDYTQQLRLKVGNHNSLLIPDFVLLPFQKGSYASAYAVIEAKRSITKDDELQEALSQARSYARQLGAKYSAVISQEKVWVTAEKDVYNDIIFDSTWMKLQDADEFMKLRGILEKR